MEQNTSGNKPVKRQWSNLAWYAKEELDALYRKSTTPEDMPVIEKFNSEILELVDAFGRSGQSGGSAPFVSAAIVETISKLLSFKPLSPINGDDDEWFDVSEQSDMESETLFQNKRLSNLFKDKEGCWYLDAIVFVRESGVGFTSGSFEADGIKLTSHAYVKSFPFEPKTFYVDVVEELRADEHDREYCIYHIKDFNQVEAAKEYYNLKPTNNVQ